MLCLDFWLNGYKYLDFYIVSPLQGSLQEYGAFGGKRQNVENLAS